MAVLVVNNRLEPGGRLTAETRGRVPVATCYKRGDDTPGVFGVLPKCEGQFVFPRPRFPPEHPDLWKCSLLSWSPHPVADVAGGFHPHLFPSRPGHPARRLLPASRWAWLCDWVWPAQRGWKWGGPLPGPSRKLPTWLPVCRLPLRKLEHTPEGPAEPPE